MASNQKAVTKDEATVKRYNLSLPKGIFDEVEAIAESRHMTVISVLRMFVKLGLLAVEIDETPGSYLLIREGDKEREIVIL